MPEKSNNQAKYITCPNCLYKWAVIEVLDDDITCKNCDHVFNPVRIREIPGLFKKPTLKLYEFDQEYNDWHKFEPVLTDQMTKLIFDHIWPDGKIGFQKSERSKTIEEMKFLLSLHGLSDIEIIEVNKK